jgi:hypothetical protein
MPRRPAAQIVRDCRVDGSVTFALRVRAGGHDARVPLGNSGDGWDEVRAERARRELQAKLELGLWTPQPGHSFGDAIDQPTFRELATDWFEDRRRNPEIREATIKNDLWALTRYLLPFLGELFPSQITLQTVKAYRRHIPTRTRRSSPPPRPASRFSMPGLANRSGRSGTTQSTRRSAPWRPFSTRPRTTAWSLATSPAAAACASRSSDARARSSGRMSS